MRASWKAVILMLSSALLALLAYKGYSALAFLHHLNTFEVSIIKEGMPGSLRSEVIVSSDGLVAKYETIKGQRRLVASGSLSEGEVASLRQALKHLRTVKGPYYRPLRDRVQAANYLDIGILLDGQFVRNISLHNVAQPKVTLFLDSYNEIVDERFRVLYRRD